jgi:hypothetical protein
LETARNQVEGLFAAFAAGKYRYNVAGDIREDADEALTGECIGQPLSRESR